MNITTSGETIFQNVVTFIFSPIYQLVAALAVVYFLYGAARFIYEMREDPAERSIGKTHLFWGLIGLFIIFSIGGFLPLFNRIIGGMFQY